MSEKTRKGARVCISIYRHVCVYVFGEIERCEPAHIHAKACVPFLSTDVACAHANIIIMFKIMCKTMCAISGY